MTYDALALAAIALTLAGCGGTAAKSSASDAGVGVCVGDARKPSGCQTKWVLDDTCKLLSSASMVQVAVFDGVCPGDQKLSAGDVSTAIQTQSVAPDQPIVPVSGLEQKPYAFALLLRDKSCHVIAWGCTEADLGAVTEIDTGLKNWSAPDPNNRCTAATGGGCTAPATCNAGVCK